MSVLIAMVVGVLIGAGVGSALPKGPDLFFINVMSGLVGSILGLGAYYLIFLQTATSALFDPAAIVFSVLGALLITVLFNSMNVAVAHRNDG